MELGPCRASIPVALEKLQDRSKRCAEKDVSTRWSKAALSCPELPTAGAEIASEVGRYDTEALDLTDFSQ